MNISVINYSINMGGTDRVSVDLANLFASKGHFVDFVTLKKKDSDFFKLFDDINRHDLGYQADDSAKKGLGYFDLKAIYCFLKAIRYLRSAKADLVVVNWTSINIFILLASFFSRDKNIVCIEHMHYGHPSAIWKLLRWVFYRFSYRIVCLTDEDMYEYKKIGAKAVKIYNPVSCSEKDNFERGDKSDRVFAAVGRLDYQKGFDILLRAFSVVSKKYPNAELKIAGGGKEKDSLSRLSYELGVSSKVKFFGAVKDIKKFYNSADFFVLSSRYEGFGLVIVEAQQNGLPVISFDCPRGPSEIIEHEKNGILVSPESESGLAQAMLRLIEEQGLADRLSKEGLSSASRFLPDRIYSVWETEILNPIDARNNSSNRML